MYPVFVLCVIFSREKQQSNGIRTKGENVRCVRWDIDDVDKKKTCMNFSFPILSFFLLPTGGFYSVNMESVRTYRLMPRRQQSAQHQVGSVDGIYNHSDKTVML